MCLGHCILPNLGSSPVWLKPSCRQGQLLQPKTLQTRYSPKLVQLGSIAGGLVVKAEKSTFSPPTGQENRSLCLSAPIAMEEAMTVVLVIQVSPWRTPVPVRESLIELAEGLSFENRALCLQYAPFYPHTLTSGKALACKRGFYFPQNPEVTQNQD